MVLRSHPDRAMRFAAVALAACALVLAGCASKPRDEAQACVYPENPTQAAPSWVCPPHPLAGQAVTGFGTYPKSAAGYQFSLDQAAAKARAELATQFKTRAQSVIQRAVATTGMPGTDERVQQAAASLTRQITDQTLSGAKLVRSSVDAKGHVYALVGIEPESAKRQMEAALESAMKADRATWERVSAGRTEQAVKEQVARAQD